MLSIFRIRQAVHIAPWDPEVRMHLMKGSRKEASLILGLMQNNFQDRDPQDSNAGVLNMKVGHYLVVSVLRPSEGLFMFVSLHQTHKCLPLFRPGSSLVSPLTLVSERGKLYRSCLDSLHVLSDHKMQPQVSQATNS